MMAGTMNPLQVGAGRMNGFLTGWRNIAMQFAVTQSAVKGWRESGAPILLLGQEPVTQLDDLWRWLKANQRKLEGY